MSQFTKQTPEGRQLLWQIPGVTSREIGDRDVPSVEDGFGDWSFVDAKRVVMDKSRKHALFYRANAAELIPVRVVIYGEIVSSTLNPLGNWNNRDWDAWKAHHNIELAAGGREDAFRGQLEAIAFLQEFVADQLGVKDYRAKRPNEITLRHRVFSKKRGRRHEEEELSLPGEDPDGNYKKISKEWALNRLCLQRLEKDGSKKDINHSAIRCGDFVEVEAEVDIVTIDPEGNVRRAKSGPISTKGRKVNVHLNIVRVLKLEKATKPMGDSQKERGQDNAHPSTSSMVTE